MIVPHGTDSAYLHKRGVIKYGFTPMILDTDTAATACIATRSVFRSPNSSKAFTSSMTYLHLRSRGEDTKRNLKHVKVTVQNLTWQVAGADELRAACQMCQPGQAHITISRLYWGFRSAQSLRAMSRSTRSCFVGSPVGE